MRQHQRKAIFVTGGSGYLGAHFIWHLLVNTNHHIIANMRISEKQKQRLYNEDKNLTEEEMRASELSFVKQRLLSILEKTAHSYALAEDRIKTLETLACASGRISIVLNDLSIKGNDPDPSSSIEFEPLDVVECWHFAAYLTPERKKGDELLPSEDYQNVTMTQNALHIGASLGAAKIFYVSTAYVSGNRSDLIAEEMFDFSKSEPDFRNAYERSKYFSEKCSYDYCKLHDLSLTVLRPSIVIGGRGSKDSGGAETGFYGVLKAFWRLRGRKLKEKIQIPVSLEAGLDLIAVDDFLNEIWDIRNQERYSALQSEQKVEGFTEPDVFHLCAGETVKPFEGFYVTAAYYNAPVEPLLIDNIEKASISARALASQLSFHADYIGHALNFERKRKAPKPFTDVEVLNYVTSIARTFEYGAVEDIFQISLQEGYQGIKLPVFDTGACAKDGKTILFCHGLGMGADFLVPLASHLKKAGHRFITWETRITPSLTQSFENKGVRELKGSALSCHAQDGLAILNALGLAYEPVSVAGWSTGAAVAGEMAGLRPKSIEQLLLLNGNFTLGGSAMTAFQRNLSVVMPWFAKNKALVSRFYPLAFEKSGRLTWQNMALKVYKYQSDRVMRTELPLLDHIIDQPVRNAEVAYRYACQMADYFSSAPWDWIRSISTPTWIMTCDDDSMAHPSGSIKVHEIMTQSVLKRYAQGDHFKLYHDKELFDDIAQVLDSR